MKTIKILAMLAVIAAMSVLYGCRKHYINGDLDGQWQVLTIEYLSDGHEENVKSKQIYYSFNLHTVHLRQSHGSPGWVVGNMKYDEKTMTLAFPLVEDVVDLSAWGMNSATTTFAVKHLSKEKLVIASDYSVVTCRKF